MELIRLLAAGAVAFAAAIGGIHYARSQTLNPEDVNKPWLIVMSATAPNGETREFFYEQRFATEDSCLIFMLKNSRFQDDFLAFRSMMESRRVEVTVPECKDTGHRP